MKLPKREMTVLDTHEQRISAEQIITSIGAE